MTQPIQKCCDECGCDGRGCANNADWREREKECRKIGYCHDHNCPCHHPIHKVSDVVRESNVEMWATKNFDAAIRHFLSSIVERIEGEKEIVQGKIEIPYKLAAIAHNEALDRAITIIKSSME